MIKVNKSQWKVHKFGEIVSNISERAEPKDTKLDIYVGLEHLDPDCVHIRRKGHPSDVKGTKLRIYPGDIIFGKRRAYQRKAAIVDFDGICSAHAMVVRANSKVILPELLPHFMHSDVFMHRAVDVSEGSLSPTIKWKILAEQPFKMPPPDDQKRLADLLWSIDNSIEKEINCLNYLLILKNSFRKKYFLNQKTLVPLKKIADFTAGGTPSTEKREYWENGNMLWMSSGEVHNKRIFNTEQRITELGFKNSSAKKIPVKTTVIALAGQGKTKGTVAITEVELTTNQSVAAIMPKFDLIDPHYLYHNLDSRYSDFRYITGKENSRSGLNLGILKEFQIAFHDKNEQKVIANIFDNLDSITDQMTKKTNSTKLIYKSLINQVFG